MSKFYTKIFFLLSVAVFSAAPSVALAAADPVCFCRSNLDQSVATVLNVEKEDEFGRVCISDGPPAESEEKCKGQETSGSNSQKHFFCTYITETAGGLDPLQQCTDQIAKFDKDLASLRQSVLSSQEKAGQSEFIPRCLFEETLPQECRTISIFVFLGINIARYLFTIIGALALLFFFFGAFRLILSQGNAERVKSGFGMMIWSMIGLVVIFSAYLLVTFVAEVMDVGEEFRL